MILHLPTALASTNRHRPSLRHFVAASPLPPAINELLMPKHCPRRQRTDAASPSPNRHRPVIPTSPLPKLPAVERDRSVPPAHSIAGNDGLSSIRTAPQSTALADGGRSRGKIRVHQRVRCRLHHTEPAEGRVSGHSRVRAVQAILASKKYCAVMEERRRAASATGTACGGAAR